MSFPNPIKILKKKSSVGPRWRCVTPWADTNIIFEFCIKKLSFDLVALKINQNYFPTQFFVLITNVILDLPSEHRKTCYAHISPLGIISSSIILSFPWIICPRILSRGGNKARIDSRPITILTRQVKFSTLYQPQ